MASHSIPEGIKPKGRRTLVITLALTLLALIHSNADALTVSSPENGSTHSTAPFVTTDLGTRNQLDFFTDVFWYSEQRAFHKEVLSWTVQNRRQVPSLLWDKIDEDSIILGVALGWDVSGKTLEYSIFWFIKDLDGCFDPDSDGYGNPASAACPNAGEDCNDSSAEVYPGAPELCDGMDNQCPGDPGYVEIDEGC